MSLMSAEIRRIVTEDVSPRIGQLDVIYEAITNAIQAGATKVSCTLDSSSQFWNKLPLEKELEKRVDSIRVVDNGIGFTNENYESFCKYRSDHKKDFGCKGVGRMIYLKVFETVTFTSRFKENGREVTFVFDLDFDTQTTTNIEKDVDENETIVEFSGVTRQYLDQSRGRDRRIVLDLAEIAEQVRIHLTPVLYFCKKSAKPVTIEIVDATTHESISIGSEDIPEFKERSFRIRASSDEYEFALNYALYPEDGRLHAFHCADQRTVCSFADKELKLALPQGYTGIFLLESEYLRNRVNNDRNDFDIYPVRIDLFSPISWETINQHVKAQLSDILTSEVPGTSDLNRGKLKEIETERPYLVAHIEPSDIEMAGYLDKGQIIDRAKKRFDRAKEKVLLNANKAEFTDADLRAAIELAQNELVSYINDRIIVLGKLQKLLDEKESVEGVIHDLLMKRKTDGDYFRIEENNLWLIDDRFTTYSYAASDLTVDQLLRNIGDEAGDEDFGSDRPDLALFFSDDPSKPQPIKTVLIELKPFEYKSKSDRQKFAGIQQLMDYIQAFQKREEVEEVYAYLITDIDPAFAKRLTNNEFIPMYSSTLPIYHKFYKEIPASIFVISAKTLIADAESRNRVFLEIMKKQSRLTELLNPL